MDLNSICADLRNASNILAGMSSGQKNKALQSVRESILAYKTQILDDNAKDVEKARNLGMAESLVERLALDEKKFKSIIDGIDTVIGQPDPVGEEVGGWNHKNGMSIRKVRVPMGVVAIIYESRPNVTVDAFSLAFKSGNSILLRGSSNALISNKILTKAIQEGLKAFGLENAIYLCTSGDHSEVNEILEAVGKIDVVLPRGSAKLINLVTQNAKIPVIQTGAGVCHLYIDESAKIDDAVKIAVNAKTQRPGACNAIETILVHEKCAEKFLSELTKELSTKVLIHADKESYSILKNTGYEQLIKANDEDFGFEFLDFEMAVKIVEGTDEAIEFINSHNTKHSEAIVSQNYSSIKDFQIKIDAACVYVNASTRFTDGGEFGFGAELGISTQKLHARGPMGADALTTTKFLIEGNGNIR